MTGPERFAAALVEVVRDLSKRSPAPRDLPFYGLDLPPGCGARSLDRLSELGIFRVYEKVLELGAGFGSASRWLARSRGCRVFATEPADGLAQANLMLTRRAHLERQVRIVRASLGRLPFEAAAFTHAWSVDGIDALSEEETDPAFREAFRVIRPGGHIAFRVRVETSSPRISALRRAGFVEVREQPADELREGRSTIAQIAWGQLAALAGPFDRETRGALEPPSTGSSIAHVFAQKPT